MIEYTKDVADRVLRILQASGQVDQEKMKEVMVEAESRSGRALALVMKELVDEELVMTVLSRAYALRRKNLAPEDVNVDAVTSIPKKMILDEHILPFAREGRFLRVGTVDPTKATLANQIKAISNQNVEFFLIKPSDFEACMATDAVQEAVVGKEEEKAPEAAPAPVKKVRKRSAYDLDDAGLVIKFVDDILQHSIDTDTSDIHVEPYRETARIRFRINGVLEAQDQFSEYLFHNYLAVVTRFKILADCDISEKRLPQDGAITFRTNDGEDVDTRFNVLPGKNGERICIRLLKGDPSLSIDKIGFKDADLQKLIEAITAPQGMVLVTGPTGSGKTTTLYGALQYINDPGTNIMTAEDPVEYYLEGLGQTQANEKIGLSFSAILRAFLRQDPEVILVGEIRDQETVEIAVKAALTGHLLLSTLHTNDAIATISRLLNMGVPSFMISAALSLVVAQRLARRNCQNCLVPDEGATPEALKYIGFTEEELQTFQPRKGGGCAACEGSGYKGRQGIYEVLRVTPQVEEAILKQAQAPEILEAARYDNFLTMQEVGRDYVKEGILCLEEFTRVLVVS
ncbi:MAG: GspE/PulE family protein [Parvibaculales bacterium]